jgi:hypothetical protein
VNDGPRERFEVIGYVAANSSKTIKTEASPNMGPLSRSFGRTFQLFFSKLRESGSTRPRRNLNHPTRRPQSHFPAASI